MSTRLKTITSKNEQSFLDGMELYRNTGQSNWMFRVYISESSVKKYYVRSTRTSDLKKAKQFAINEYAKIQVKQNEGKRVHQITFSELADRFFEYYKKTVHDDIKIYHTRVKLGLLNEYYGNKTLQDITKQSTDSYMNHRRKQYKRKTENKKKGIEGKVLSNKTLHQDFICFRKVMSFGVDHGYIDKEVKVVKYSREYRRRGWFNYEEWKTLKKYMKEKIKHSTYDDDKNEWETLYDMSLFLISSGLRVEEALDLKVKHCKIRTKHNDMLIEVVKGKTIERTSVGMLGCISSFKRVVSRNNLSKDDYLFSDRQSKSRHRNRKTWNRVVRFRNMLMDLNLRFDSQSNKRDMKAMRHSYAVWRLLQGVSIYDLHVQMGTSVLMIEKHYGSHLKSIMRSKEINKMTVKFSELDL